MEGGQVRGFGGVDAARVPLPSKAVWLCRECGVLDRSPEKQVLADLLDVRRPSVALQAFGNHSSLPSLWRDAGVKKGRDLDDGAPVDPAVLPKQSALAIAYLHCCRGEEEGTLLP
jgi:hypothetical protein